MVFMKMLTTKSFLMHVVTFRCKEWVISEENLLVIWLGYNQYIVTNLQASNDRFKKQEKSKF